MGSGATPDRAILRVTGPLSAASGAAAGRRRRLAAALLLVASLAGPTFADAPTGSEATRVKSGTGFYVSRDGFLLTSAHVVAGCSNVSVWGHDGVARESHVVAADPRLDLALLWAHGGRLGQSAVAAAAPPRTGEDVFTLGFGVIATQPLRPVLVEGSLLGSSTAHPGNRVLVIKARLQAGNSGGALLAGNGSLLGMVVGRDEERPDLGVAIPSDSIEALLAAHRIVLPGHDPAISATQLLGAISALVQCSAPAEGRRSAARASSSRTR
jgi:S1-C subfamily serine protease